MASATLHQADQQVVAFFLVLTIGKQIANTRFSHYMAIL